MEVVDNGNGTLTATPSTDETPVKFTNTYSATPITAAIPVTKILEAEEGTTPPDISGRYTFTLSGNDGAPEPKTKTVKNPDKDGGEAAFDAITFTLPGTFTYTVTESGIVVGVTNDAEAETGKTATVVIKDDQEGALVVESVEGVEFTNIYEEVELSLIKTWDDADNQDGKRPDAAAFAKLIHLYADGKDTGRKPTVTDNGDNTYTVDFGGMPKATNGVDIVYTVVEDAITGYTPVPAEPVELKDGEPGELTNTHTPETIRLAVRKRWDDNRNVEGLRPATLTVYLLANNKRVMTVTLDAASGWDRTVTDLPKYADGQEIRYVWREPAIPGYRLVQTYVNGITTTFVNRRNTTPIDEYETPLGLGQVVINVGDCFE